MKSTIIYKLATSTYIQLNYYLNMAWTAIYTKIKPYKYCAERYSDTFLEQNVVEYGESSDNKKATEVIYCFWTGDNEITPNREKSLKSMRQNCGVEIKLITPQNLSQYILPEHPLPEAYQYLSLVHRSDYLRCYFMHHHGGGYADIKTYRNNWKLSFDKLNSSTAFISGYPEKDYTGIAYRDGLLGRDIMTYWRLVIGNGSFICKPYTTLTYEWYHMVNKRLNGMLNSLKENPGNTFGSNVGYPIAWADIQGAIFHPLCLKYNEKIIQDINIKPDFSQKYR